MNWETLGFVALILVAILFWTVIGAIWLVNRSLDWVENIFDGE